jgi:hypothetical protein
LEAGELLALRGEVAAVEIDFHRHAGTLEERGVWGLGLP